MYDLDFTIQQQKRCLGQKPEKYDDGDLFDADPICLHEVISPFFSGVCCVKCNGWFCY